MPLPKYKRLLIFAITICSLTSTTASARFEQRMLPVNPEGKKVTFTFYHFGASKTATLMNLSKNIGETSAKTNGLAAISAAAKTSFSYQSGRIIFSKTTSYFIKDRAFSTSAKSLSSSKRTFILTDGTSHHAIGYAPSVSERELAHAMQKFLATSGVKFANAVIIDSGNQCGFYKTNGTYRPYYLKELKKPAKVIIIK